MHQRSLHTAVDVAHAQLARYFQGHRLEQWRTDEDLRQPDLGAGVARRGDAAAIRDRTNSSPARPSGQSGGQHRNGLRSGVSARSRWLCISAHRPRDGCASGNTCRIAVNIHREELMKLLKGALAIAVAMLLAESASAALLSIAQYPLFLTHRTLPNILVIYDNSESMDGTMAGKLIAGDDPTTRGNIARGVIRSTISSFSGQFNWGLESFGIGGPGLYSTYPYWLGNDTTMVFTDDCVSGVSASNGGLRCIPNPQPFTGGNYVTYDRASDDPDINDVLYIGYFGVGAWATSAGGGNYNFYFTHNPGAAF